MKQLDINLTILKRTRKQVLKNLVKNIRCLKRKRIQVFKIWLKYVKLEWMLMDETQLTQAMKLGQQNKHISQ